MATPCHTRDSICYYVTKGDKNAVFTGSVNLGTFETDPTTNAPTSDTLFQGGCGRFFEGTPAEMHASLSYLATLPNDTVVYNGHEYTRGNLKFAQTVEPSNSALSQLQQLCDSDKITAGKSTMGEEKAWNVFMRLESKLVQYVVFLPSAVFMHSILCTLRADRKATGKTDKVEVMEKLREMKNAM
jgi:hydroxyacylglutathione hydrolase